MTTTKDLATALSAGYAQGPEAVTQAFGAALAPRVEVRHEPPESQDGVYDRQILLAAQSGRVAQFRRVMPDYHEAAVVSAFADEIRVELEVSGTLPDGTAVRISGTDRLTVRDGEITAMVSVFASDQMPALIAALTSA